jgi:hypothetical protein
MGIRAFNDPSLKFQAVSCPHNNMRLNLDWYTRPIFPILLSEKQVLINNAKIVGNRLLDGLNSLEEKHPIVGDVIGLGLYVGIELATNSQTLEPAAAHASYIINRAKD